PPGEKCLRCKPLHVSCCQFNGQWQPIQGLTQLCYDNSIFRYQLHIGSDSLCTLEEEIHCWILNESSALRQGLEVWQSQGIYKKLVLSAYVQDFTAGHEYLERGAGL